MSDDNGLYYMRARYYSPELKRFINADTIKGTIYDSRTLNGYAYANGNPVSLVDPFGTSAEPGGKAKGKPTRYRYISNISRNVQHGLSNSESDSLSEGYSIWDLLGSIPEVILDLSITIIDKVFDTHFGVLSTANSAVGNAQEANTEYLKMETSALNHYKNIWSVGSGQSDEILPVIVYKEETMESYLQLCKNVYNNGGSGTFSIICDPEETQANEINGYLLEYDPYYYELCYKFGLRAAFEYFPKTAASLVPGGSAAVDGIYDATSPYKVLQ